MPSYPSRIPVAPFINNQSQQGAYWHRSSLTRHRSLSDFTEHENSYHNPWLEFATPQQNLPIWNENFPPTRLEMTVVPCHQSGSSTSQSYCRVPHTTTTTTTTTATTQSSLARSLSQQNLPAKFSSYAFDSQLRSLCMGIEKRFNNNNNSSNGYLWLPKNSNSNEYLRNDLEGIGLSRGLDLSKLNANSDSNLTDVLWPKTPSSSSESAGTSELVRSLKKNVKKSVNQISGNPKNLEKWPKSLETLPKTPTDIRSKSVMSLDNNMLSNYPVFPCDPTGPTPELNRSAATGTSTTHGFGHKPADRCKFRHNMPSRRNKK